MKISVNDKMKKTAIVVATALFMGGATGLGIASAQGPTGGIGGFAGPGAAGGAVMACSTTNYTDVAAKALGMESAALRQALVSGKSLEDIATSKGVTIDTVDKALETAREADLDQAVKDGLLTQDQYNRMTGEAGQSSSADSDNAAPEATQQANQPGQGNPNQMPPRPNGPRGIVRVPDHNTVDELVVAAKALNISCADLVKAMQGGQSIAQVAVTKNVQIQSVVDALTTAFKAAITQDVQEGLTAQAVADGQISQVINRAGSFVYSTRQQRGPDGMGGGGPRSAQDNGGQPDGQPGGQPGILGQGGQGPRGGKGQGNPPSGDNNGQGTPQATQTATTSS